MIGKGDYWLNIPDCEINTGQNIFRYWKAAKRLKIGIPYTDKNGIPTSKQNVTLNLDTLKKTPEAVELLKQILA
jgi:hypothetical protein